MTLKEVQACFGTRIGSACRRIHPRFPFSLRKRQRLYIRFALLHVSEKPTVSAFDVEVDARGGSILDYLLTLQQHLEIGDPCPPHPVHRLGRFGYWILRGLGEALFG